MLNERRHKIMIPLYHVQGQAKLNYGIEIRKWLKNGGGVWVVRYWIYCERK